MIARGLPLRVSVPIAMMIAGTILLVGMAITQYQSAMQIAERYAVDRARLTGAMLAGEIEAAFRTERGPSVRTTLQRANGDRMLLHALLVDRERRVLGASTHADSGRLLSETQYARFAGCLDERTHPEEVRISITADGVASCAVFPVLMAQGYASRPEERYGDLILLHDLTALRAANLSIVKTQLVAAGMACALLCLLFWLQLRRMLLGRIERLKHVAERLSHGELLNERPIVEGNDELSALSRAFIRITAQLRETNRRITTSEQRFRSLVEDSSDVVLLIDYDGRIKYANPVAEGRLGMGGEGAAAQALDEFVAPEDREALRASLRLLAERITSVESCQLRVHDESGDGGIEAVISGSEHGNELVVSGRDLSERERSRRELARRDRILTGVAEVSSYVLGTDLSPETFTSALKILGGAAEAHAAYLYRVHRDDAGDTRVSRISEWLAPGMGDRQVATPRSASFREVGLERWETLLSKGMPLVATLEDMSPRERELMESLNISSEAALPVFVGGEWWGFVGFRHYMVARDWSRSEIDALSAAAGVIGAAVARNQHAEDLRRLNQALEDRIEDRTRDLSMIFELSPDGFVSVDADDKVAYANPAFRAMTGVSPDEITGAHASRLVRLLVERSAEGSDVPGVDGTWHGRPVDIEIVRPRRRIVCVVAKERTDAEGRLLGRVMYFRDITHETEVSRMKSEFLSAAAHELRTPLASVYGYAELLTQDGFDDETRQEMIATIRSQSEALVALVNELLDLARIEARAGRDLVLESTNVVELVEKVASQWLVPSPDRPIELAIEAGTCHAYADGEKLAQALVNVLSNAYKYSDSGPVEIRVACGEEHGQRQVAIRVRDHGIGMNATEQVRMFDRFWRADVSRSIQGTGLGMSLVKEIMDLHGGTVRVVSAPGQGTTVTLSLQADEDSDVVPHRRSITLDGSGAPGPTTQPARAVS